MAMTVRNHDKLLSHLGDRGSIWMAVCVSGECNSGEETAGHRKGVTVCLGDVAVTVPWPRCQLPGSVHVKSDMLFGEIRPFSYFSAHFLSSSIDLIIFPKISNKKMEEKTSWHQLFWRCKTHKVTMYNGQVKAIQMSATRSLKLLFIHLKTPGREANLLMLLNIILHLVSSLSHLHNWLGKIRKG